MELNKQFMRLIEVIVTLRDPIKGCPWDLKQTHSSLLKYLIEECYEYIDACEQNNQDEMKNELGDILLQVLLYSKIAEDNKTFNLEDVCQNLADKLIFRHPHVFGDTVVSSIDEIKENWEQLKAKEKAIKKNKIQTNEENKAMESSLLKMPSLMSSEKIGYKAANYQFDWNDYSQVMYKVEEEWQELKEELPPTGNYNKDRVEEELGDMLFSLAQLSRHLKISPEEALRKANKKFINRFEQMLVEANLDQEEFKKLGTKEKEEYWNKVKKKCITN